MGGKYPDMWTTPWGTVLMQGESLGPGGGPRFYWVQWHNEANPPMHLRDDQRGPEGHARKRVAARIERWLRIIITENITDEKERKAALAALSGRGVG
jgi:hypothetical protein